MQITFTFGLDLLLSLIFGQFFIFYFLFGRWFPLLVAKRKWEDKENCIFCPKFDQSSADQKAQSGWWIGLSSTYTHTHTHIVKHIITFVPWTEFQFLVTCQIMFLGLLHWTIHCRFTSGYTRIYWKAICTLIRKVNDVSSKGTMAHLTNFETSWKGQKIKCETFLYQNLEFFSLSLSLSSNPLQFVPSATKKQMTLSNTLITLLRTIRAFFFPIKSFF